MRTEDLIAELASRSTPVRPLASPVVRLAGWCVVALGSATIGLSVFGLRPQAIDHLRQPEFVATALLAAGTTLLAGAAALVLAIPGAERSLLLRGTATTLVVLWAGLLVNAIVQAGHGLSAAADWPICFVRVVAIALPPAWVLFGLLRRAAPLRPAWTSALGASASMAVATGAIQFICPIDDPAHAFLGHLGPVLVFGALAAWTGPRLLKPSR